MALSVVYIHAFSLTLLSIQRSESVPLIFYMLILINIARVLLATIRDKGICPCPRCLTPKYKMDQTGAKRDSQFREKNVRRYLLDYVRTARDAIYKRAFAIGGVVIDWLLKPTSSVPTLVSFFVPCYADL